ncbi:4-hydroxy-tetrahydrodipicolinate synthase [Nannocystis radixulma]|uniref:4-hydroxy-tetrahydrodipicolinate synthase n=1 Tax=Nannocystis radixulma TaxID=2995305 RepID=A0ABT5B6B5_9BACT|nr:4-hydroxy-tetrahydrodipicolinate synthase [Nannocystis radixulma]MDC0669008.1 4-hydroxy-tetrahydrodipicolinate synthase [Nannocystis radixulma]
MFRGALTALITPMRRSSGGALELDEPAIVALAESQIAAGIHGLVPCGTTGEASTLSEAEHLRVVELVVKTARRRVPVLAGAGTNDTAKAIELARACKAAGADGTLQVTPYYNRPTQAGLVAHFRAVAEASGLPVVVYNVPGRTGVDLLAETVAELAAIPGIVGIKEATADMNRAARLRELLHQRPEFALLSGDDYTVFPFLALGGHGVISVTSNVAPQWVAELCNAAAAGRWDDARALHDRHYPLARALFAQPNPIPVKAAVALQGRCTGDLRLPLVAIDPTSREGLALADTLRTLGLLS